MENLTRNLLKTSEVIARSACNWGRGFLESNLTIPTCVRKLGQRGQDETPPEYDAAIAIGLCFAFFGNVIGSNLAVSGNEIAQYCEGGILMTNLASGVYETFRYQRQKGN